GRSEADVEPGMTEEGDGGFHGWCRVLEVQVRMDRINLEEVTPEGATPWLEPLSRSHQAMLCAVGLDDELWRWIPKPVRTAEEMAEYVDFALAERAAGRALPFAVIDRATEQAIGSTRFGAIEPAHRRVEIGWTW